jgi:hypothetical protein
MRLGRRGNPAALSFAPPTSSVRGGACYSQAVPAHPIWPALLSFAIPIVGWSLGFIVDHDIFAWLGLFGGISVAAMSGAAILWAKVAVAGQPAPRLDTRAQLLAFVSEAEAIKTAIQAQRDLAEIGEDARTWHERVAPFVRERLGEVYAARLASDPGVRGGEPFGLPTDYLTRWRWLNNRTVHLQAFAGELSREPD